VTTAARFHFGEMFFPSDSFACSDIFGIAPVMLVMFFITLEARHSFIIPTGDYQFRSKDFDLIMVTPRMHGIHHSIVQRETNSNWGRFFVGGQVSSDIRRDVSQDAITLCCCVSRETS